jgi:hypothetical protein
MKRHRDCLKQLQCSLAYHGQNSQFKCCSGIHWSLYQLRDCTSASAAQLNRAYLEEGFGLLQVWGRRFVFVIVLRPNAALSNTKLVKPAASFDAGIQMAMVKGQSVCNTFNGKLIQNLSYWFSSLFGMSLSMEWYGYLWNKFSQTIFILQAIQNGTA